MTSSVNETIKRLNEKQDRTDRSFAPDARKAREVVRKMKSGSLPLLAKEIAKVTGDLTAKHEIEEAFHNICVANEAYRREELLDHNQLIEWMGAANGAIKTLPAGSPEHKVKFVNAWNAVVKAVNEATKVGVEKRHREHPITLVSDPESDRLILSPEEMWG